MRDQYSGLPRLPPQGGGEESRVFIRELWQVTPARREARHGNRDEEPFSMWEGGYETADRT